MSREIKFRVWDKDLCEYVTGAEFGLARMSIRPDEDNGRVFSFDTLFPGRYTWEQYTGLKDKNGKEIYEGDIVRVVRSYGYDFLPKGAKAVVEFDEKELCYKLSGQGKYRLTANKEVEVIGDIHENPELLEDEKGEE